MKIDYLTLKEVWYDYEFLNFSDNITFDWINVCRISSQPTDDSHHLFFAFYDVTPEIDGWYDVPIDRRSIFPKVTFDKPHWSFVIERNISLSQLNQNSRIIIVDNINIAARRLFDYVLKQVHPKVCAVTGSVGKTTTASFLEQIVALKYKCLRVYAKRISPPILFSSIINNLQKDTEFIVLEMSLWRRNHVEILASLLRPNYGIFLNVKEVHLDVDNLNNTQNIFESKSKILTDSTIGILNIDDPLISTIRRERKIIRFAINNKLEADVFVEHIDILKNNVTITTPKGKINFKPYLLTKLTLYQILACCCIGIEIGINYKEIEEAIPTLLTKENRILKFETFNHLIVFDGQRTMDGRMEELGTNFYTQTTLILYKFDDNFPEHLLNNFPKVFEKFTRVRILLDYNNFKQLSQLPLPNNTTFVASKKELMRDISSDGLVVLHYSLYYKDKNLSFKNPLHLLFDHE